MTTLEVHRGLAPPGSGQGFELRVVSGWDFHTVLCTVSDYQTLQFVPMISAVGSGSVVIPSTSLAISGSFIPDGPVCHVVTSATSSSFRVSPADAVNFPPGQRFQVAAGSPSRPACGPTVYTVYTRDPGLAGFVTIHVTPAFPAPLSSSDTIQVQSLQGSALLSYENLFQCLLDGQVQFEFLGETVMEQQVDPSEQLLVTISGPGTAQMLGWGRAMPDGWPATVYKLSGLDDKFPGPLVDTSLWNYSSGTVAINTAGTVQLTAAPAASVLSGGPFYALSSSISAQIGPMLPGTLDGSELSQMYVSNPSGQGYALMGISATHFYAEVQDAGGHVVTHVLPVYDSTAHAYWRISMVPPSQFLFWTSADGSTWVKQWSSPGLVPAWDYTRSNLTFSAKYDLSGQVMTVSNLNAEVLVKPDAGLIFTTQPVMQAWETMLSLCQSRGTLLGWAVSFSGTQDSGSNPWTDSQTFQVPVGADLLSLLGSYAGTINADWIVSPGRVVNVGLPGSIGTDRSQQILFYEGNGVTTKTRQRVRDAIGNMVASQDDSGFVYTYQDSTSQATWGQRELWVAAGGTSIDSSSTSGLVQASLQQSKVESSSRTLAVIWGMPGKTPFRDFNVGDWVGLETAGGTARETVRVIAIGVSVAADGSVTCELTLETYRQWLDLQLKYLINKFGGQAVSTLGVVPTKTVTAGTATSPGTVTQAPPMAALSDVQNSQAIPGQVMSQDPGGSGMWTPVSQVPGVVNGTTIYGAQFVAYGNTGEILVYTGPPTLGNLMMSVSALAGSDTPGNPYVAGVGLYRGTAYLEMLIDGTLNIPAIHMVTGLPTEKNYASLYNLTENAGLANEFENAWFQGPESTVDSAFAALTLESTAADLSTAYAGVFNTIVAGVLTQVAYWQANGIHVNKNLYGASGTLAIPDNINVGGVISQNLDGWHTISLASGLTGQLGGGVGIRVMLLPWNAVWIDVECSWSTAATNTFTCGSLPNANYYPNVTRHIPMTVTGNVTNAGSFPRVFIATSGAIQLVVPATAAGATIAGSCIYPTN